MHVFITAGLLLVFNHSCHLPSGKPLGVVVSSLTSGRSHPATALSTHDLSMLSLHQLPYGTYTYPLAHPLVLCSLNLCLEHKEEH